MVLGGTTGAVGMAFAGQRVALPHGAGAIRWCHASSARVVNRSVGRNSSVELIASFTPNNPD